MIRTGLKYGAILIATYLGVYYASGAGTIINDGADGSANVIKALQGRG